MTCQLPCKKRFPVRDSVVNLFMLHIVVVEHGLPEV